MTIEENVNQIIQVILRDRFPRGRATTSADVHVMSNIGNIEK